MGCQMRAHTRNIADEIVRQIEHMRTEVTHNAICTLAVIAPLILGIAAKTHQEGKLTVIDLPNSALIEKFAHIAVMRHPTPGEERHVAYTLSFCFLIHGSGLRCV